MTERTVIRFNSLGQAHLTQMHICRYKSNGYDLVCECGERFEYQMSDEITEALMIYKVDELDESKANAWMRFHNRHDMNVERIIKTKLAGILKEKGFAEAAEIVLVSELGRLYCDDLASTK